MSGCAGRAAAEIDVLHRRLQAWVRAEGEAAADAVLAHFDEGYSMVTPTGKMLSFADFAGAFPAMRGTRPGLIMEISDVVVRHEEARAALVTYRERQIMGEQRTDRLSTALLLDRADRPTPVWRHLQETLLP